MNAPEHDAALRAAALGGAPAATTGRIAASAGGPRWCAQPLMRGLCPAFGTELPPTPLPGLHWIAHSAGLADELGLGDWLDGDDALALLDGNALPPDGRTLASVYSGHQFGVWAGQLGDGRALLLGEVDSPQGPMEWQLKGSGLTPYSRMGDGRAVLRSSIREFLCSEAMHALGVPTTRALALVGSPAPVRRETLETAAVVTRVAPSFIRFGHFEHFAHSANDPAALRALQDAVIERFYPECRDAPVPALALLEAVSRRTARLLADWQTLGFCHGVMNTDSMSILGLTIDYGPFGFLDGHDPARIDHTRSWRALSGFDSGAQAANTALRDQFIDRAAFDAWAQRYGQRLRAEGSVDAERAARMNRSNPKYVLRNHLAETAIREARDGDFTEVQRMARVLASPFDEQTGSEHYAALPPDWAGQLEISCSS